MHTSWPTADAARDGSAPDWVSYPDPSIITRRVDASSDSIEHLLTTVAARLAPAGSLRIDLPFQRADDLVPAWWTTGRLYGSGPRLVRYARVEIELWAYHPFECELQVRARCRHLYRWGRRRRRRYFDLAHRSADSIVATIKQLSASPAPQGQGRQRG